MGSGELGGQWAPCPFGWSYPRMSAVVPVTRTILIVSPRALVARLTSMQLAFGVLVVLIGGILLSVLTTTDPLWWHLHFSQLGTFHDTSGALFNGTLVVGGTLVAVYAYRVRRDLVRLGALVGRRGSGWAAQVFLTTIGVNLALVGCVPLNVNQSVHDNVAAGMVLGFAALLLTSPVLLHRMPRRLLLTTLAIFGCLFAGGWLFVDGTINLALFEVIAFSAMFAWSGVFTHCLGERAKAPVSRPAAPDAVRAVSPEPVPAPPIRSCASESRPWRPSRLALPVARVGGAPARPSGRYRRPAARAAAPASPRPGCKGSAGPAASARSTIRVRRSRRSRAAGR
ncbi:DUF998 domain-containing protein [Microbacterium sp. dk485]|nr:DUF998 domain-containing protein [Microbacterium sp. dk485]TXK14669.1 DUF998 domain-containing protein [Microbacterium wangchenii]